MHERQEIEGRAAGKQIVYHVKQTDASSSDNNPEALAAIDAEIQALRDETGSALAQAKTLKASLATLNSTLSTTDLKAALEALRVEREEMLARLEALRKGKVRPVSGEEMGYVEGSGRCGKDWRRGGGGSGMSSG